MKGKWWLIPVAAVLVLAIVMVAFWDAIVIRVMPSAVLSKAMFNTMADMESRLENSPLTVLAGGMDPGGCQAIDIQLDTSNGILGDIRYQMNVQMMGGPRKINAQGTVSSSDGSFHLSVYADEDFAAVSSENLLDGRFYGITYESFSEDIRGILLLPLLIGENTLNSWETAVSDLQSQMEKTYELPNFSEADIRTVMTGILALDAQVTSEVLPVNGQDQGVYKVTFSASGQQIASAAGDYVQYMSAEVLELVKKFGNDADSMVSAVFYLMDDMIVKLAFDVVLEGDRLQTELILGQDAARDPIKLAYIRHSDEKLEKWSVDVVSEYDEYTYEEEWNVVHIENGIQSRQSISYDWNLESGDMVLNVSDGAGDSSVLLNLRAAESGFRLATDRFETLLSLFSDEKKTGDSACVMTVSKGTEVITPEYKNIDQWTGEDLLSLLGSVGALLGLQI